METGQEFSIKEMFRFGWETFKSRPWIFVGVTLLVLFISNVVPLLYEIVDEPIINLILVTANIIIGTFIGAGVIAFAIRAHDDVSGVELNDLWVEPARALRYFIAGVLVGIVTVVGFLLLIVPGIIFMLMLLFTLYFVVDKGLGPIEAMKASKQAVSGHKWKLLGFVLLLGLLNIAGTLALLVGLLVTIPVSMLATAHAYRTLASGGVEETATPAPSEFNRGDGAEDKPQ